MKSCVVDTGKPSQMKCDSAGISACLSEKELCPDDLMEAQEEAIQKDVERLNSRKAEFVSVECPACGSEDWIPELEKRCFEYVTCRKCRTLFMNPRPSESLLAEYHATSENYKFWAKYIFPTSEATRREKIQGPWLERVLGYCHRFSINRGVLLEVGAGFGTFAELANDSGQFEQVIAVEPTPELAQACRNRGVRVIEERIEDAGNMLPQVDVAVSFEVIEHLYDPRSFLMDLRPLMSEEGLLVLSCPNNEGFDISVLGSLSMAIDIGHLNLFNPHSLGLLVESCGFDVLEVSTPGRLDAEFVHTAIEQGKFDVSNNPFLKRVLVDEWDRLGWPFQQFLAENGLSSHMWLAARRQA